LTNVKAGGTTRKPTHCDKHASALEPRPTAPEERHDEDDDTDRNTETIGADHAVSGEQLGVSCIRESKPDTHTQNTTTAKLKQDNSQSNSIQFNSIQTSSS